MILHQLKKFIKDDEQKLALKIAVASFFILIGILSLIISASYIYQRNTEYREFQTETQVIRDRVTLPRGPINPARSPLGPKGMRGPRNIIVFDTNRQVIENNFVELDPRDTDFLFALENHENTSIEFQDHVYLISRLAGTDSIIFLFHDLTPIRDFHMTLLAIALIGSLFALIIIYLLARYLARITIEPIREQARELEIYSHNVAHELRTPLSVMRSNLELLRIKPEERFIRSTDEEITGMERIIESLLFLAKPDITKKNVEIDITKKTKEIIAKYDPENMIQLHGEKKHIYKNCSEELYIRVLCNLIENAIKYKSDGPIDIYLSNDTIKISNTIEYDLSDEEQKNLTKVFYQGDASRSSTGYGLGLALVAKIVEISGWTMRIDSKNKEFIVSIMF